MQAVRRDQWLAAQVGPRFFEALTGVMELAPPRIGLHHLQAPAQARGEPQRALTIEPTVIEIAGGLRGSDANQTGGLLCRGQQLGHALIGKAIHPHSAVRFRAGAYPVDGLRSVASLIAKGIEVALGIAAATHILDDDVVIVSSKPDGVGRVPHISLVFREMWDTTAPSL